MLEKDNNICISSLYRGALHLLDNTNAETEARDSIFYYLGKLNDGIIPSSEVQEILFKARNSSDINSTLNQIIHFAGIDRLADDYHRQQQIEPLPLRNISEMRREALISFVGSQMRSVDAILLAEHIDLECPFELKDECNKDVQERKNILIEAGKRLITIIKTVLRSGREDYNDEQAEEASKLYKQMKKMRID